MLQHTYNQIAALLEIFSEAHVQVKSWDVGFKTQLNDLLSNNSNCPLLFFEITNVSLNTNTQDFNFRVYCLDIKQKNNANSRDVLSDTAQILTDLRKWLINNFEESNIWTVQFNSSNLIPLNNYTIDYCVGWYMDITISSALIEGDCDTPVGTIDWPNIGPIEYNYLTCETLPSCPTIISIQGELENHEERIEALEQGGGGLNCDDVAACPVIITIQEDIIEINDTLSGLATVAYSGDYNDLINIPNQLFTSVNNGLSITSDVLQLGGSLTQDTPISLDTFSFSFTDVISFESSGVTFLTNILNSFTGNTSIDPNLSRLYDISGLFSLNWHLRFLSDSNGNQVFSWFLYETYDALTGSRSLNWSDRQLFDSNESLILDWSNGISVSSTLLPSINNTYSVGSSSFRWTTLFAGIVDLATSTGKEINFSGSNAANIYHATSGQNVFINTNGGLVNIGPSDGSTNLQVGSTITSNVLHNYGSDLSASYTSRSLVDKAYVDAQITSIPKFESLGVGFSGQGGVIEANSKAYLQVPYNCTINAWRVVSTISGSVVIDVWKDTYANFPPTVLDTITGSEKPTLSSQIKNQDTSLTTWTTSLTKGDWLVFNIDSSTSVTEILIYLDVTKS